MAALSQLWRSNSMGKLYGRLHYLGKSLLLRGIWSGPKKLGESEAVMSAASTLQQRCSTPERG
jgi:hypothetical protein